MNCARCDKPFVGGYLIPDSGEWFCFACVEATGVNVIHADEPIPKQELIDLNKYFNQAMKNHWILPSFPSFYPHGLWSHANVADSNSLRCCQGIGFPPRCTLKATHIPIYANGAHAGDAYCEQHIPLRKKGSWMVPLRCVRVER